MVNVEVVGTCSTTEGGGGCGQWSADDEQTCVGVRAESAPLSRGPDSSAPSCHSQ